MGKPVPSQGQPAYAQVLRVNDYDHDHDGEVFGRLDPIEQDVKLGIEIYGYATKVESL